MVVVGRELRAKTSRPWPENSQGLPPGGPLWYTAVCRGKSPSAGDLPPSEDGSWRGGVCVCAV